MTDWCEEKDNLGCLCHEVAIGLNPGFQPWVPPVRPRPVVSAILSAIGPAKVEGLATAERDESFGAVRGERSRN
jgi:hypothetical protein